MAPAKNWASADAGPGRVLDDICYVEWGDDESFRRERAKWLKTIHKVGDVKLSNMVWLLGVVASFMKRKNDAAWPGIARLSAELGWSEPTVKRALALAIEWGWLIRERRYDKTNRYFMSYSVSIKAEVEDRHSVRTALFGINGSDLPSPSNGESEIKPDLTIGSNLISPSDQVRSHPEIKPDLLYQEDIPVRDTEDRYLSERLGEAVQDKSQRQADPDLLTLLIELGDGDLSVGRERSRIVSSDLFEAAFEAVKRLGVAGCQSHIQFLREAAESGRASA